jgi:23S rRNA (pseudouridine1915-N3)-methyltransferase
MRLIVIGEGRLRAPYLEPIEHYQTLLSRYVSLELAPQRDTETVARRIPEDAYVCLLCSQGRAYESIAFSRFVEQRRMQARDVAFVIGGAFGAPPLARVDHRLSFGPMTLPHQLAWVVLLEQLYRAHKILAGEPYHY